MGILVMEGQYFAVKIEGLTPLKTVKNGKENLMRFDSYSDIAQYLIENKPGKWFICQLNGMKDDEDD